MLNFFAKRLGYLLITMLAVSLLIFVVNEYSPGQVARKILGPFATQGEVDILTEKLRHAEAVAQVTPEPVPVPRQALRAQPTLSPANLDVLVSPIALYPDAILRDLLAATQHPNEIVAANQWAHAGRDTAGSLPRNGYSDRWDYSIKAMTAYPDLLQRLTADMNWTTKLGSAYAAQPSDVMSAVQRMRTQAGSFRAPARLAQN